MTKDQLEQKIAELHEKAFALQKEIEEMERDVAKMKETEEWPKKKDFYYASTWSGQIAANIWENTSIEHNMKSIGNIFQTREQAEFAVERLKVLAEMRKFAFEPDWDCDTQCKFTLFYHMGKVKVEDLHACNYGSPVFADEETVQSCINAIGEERLKKYYFGVKDE